MTERAPDIPEHTLLGQFVDTARQLLDRDALGGWLQVGPGPKSGTILNAPSYHALTTLRTLVETYDAQHGE